MSSFRILLQTLLLCLAFPALGEELPRVNPEEVDLTAATMAGLKTELQKQVGEGKIPGGIAMTVRHGKVADFTTFGWRDLQTKAPMAEDTIFAIVSMTKPITCVAVMMLVEQGTIGIDDPVDKYIPQWKDLRVLDDARDDSKTELATVPSAADDHSSFACPYRGDPLQHVCTNGCTTQRGLRAGRRGGTHETSADLVAALAKFHWPICPAKTGPRALVTTCWAT